MNPTTQSETASGATETASDSTTMTAHHASESAPTPNQAPSLGKAIPVVPSDEPKATAQPSAIADSGEPARIVMVPIGNLRAHPRNAELYQSGNLDLLIASIKEHGLLKPITATKDNEILDGHRRVKAAPLAGRMEVPVIYIDVPDADDRAEKLVLFNLQREKVEEEKLREFITLESVEARRAEARKKSGKKQDGQDSAQGSGKAADIAATKLGRSREWARQGVKVIRVIDENIDHAEEIRKLLNEQSVNAAYTKATELGLIKASARQKSSASAKTSSPQKSAGAATSKATSADMEAATIIDVPMEVQPITTTEPEPAPQAATSGDDSSSVQIGNWKQALEVGETLVRFLINSKKLPNAEKSTWTSLLNQIIDRLQNLGVGGVTKKD